MKELKDKTKEESSKKEKSAESDLRKKIDADFIVKNMPALSSLSGSSYAPKTGEKSPQTAGAILSSGQNKHHKTGLIIISGGLVLILVLFYLAYRFLILPSLGDNLVPLNEAKPLVSDEQIKKENSNIPVEEDLVVESEELNIDPIVISDNNETEVLLSLPVISDMDQDGLSDIAESFIGTDSNNIDSDNDSYSDKEEILNNYNPVGAGLLSENSNLALFTETNRQYAVIYPKSWKINAVNDKSVLFSAPDQDFIQISYEDSDQKYENILDWYTSQFSATDNLSEDRLISSSFGPGILSLDKQFVYFLDSDGSRVFVLSYISANDSMPYLETFNMMTATLMRL